MAAMVPSRSFAADARALFQSGSKALTDGNANQAVKDFEAAYAAQPSPSLLFWPGRGLSRARRQREGGHVLQGLPEEDAQRPEGRRREGAAGRAEVEEGRAQAEEVSQARGGAAAAAAGCHAAEPEEAAGDGADAADSRCHASGRGPRCFPAAASCRDPSSRRNSGGAQTCRTAPRRDSTGAASRPEADRRRAGQPARAEAGRSADRRASAHPDDLRALRRIPPAWSSFSTPDDSWW